MPFAKRADHREPAKLEEAIEADIERLLRVRDRRGILVRLHALGDFHSAPYVRFWALMLEMYPGLAVYGYTAHPPGSEIGRAVAWAKRKYGRRFAVRWSNGGTSHDCAVSIVSEEHRPADAFICPEQTGRTAACATCGLCWGTEKNVAFLEH